MSWVTGEQAVDGHRPELPGDRGRWQGQGSSFVGLGEGAWRMASSRWTAEPGPFGQADDLCLHRLPAVHQCCPQEIWGPLGVSSAQCPWLSPWRPGQEFREASSYPHPQPRLETEKRHPLSPSKEASTHSSWETCSSPLLCQRTGYEARQCPQPWGLTFQEEQLEGQLGPPLQGLSKQPRFFLFFETRSDSGWSQTCSITPASASCVPS